MKNGTHENSYQFSRFKCKNNVYYLYFWRQGQGHFDKSARVMHYFFRGGYPPKYQIHGNLQLKYL